MLPQLELHHGLDDQLSSSYYRGPVWITGQSLLDL